jgi:hypothetical protein
MTLPDFFLAVNDAGIRLANVGGQLQLRGSANVISPEIKEAAAEHKAAILALLPPAPSPEFEVNEIPIAEPAAADLANGDATLARLSAEEQARKRAGIAAKAEREIASAETAGQYQESDQFVIQDGFRHRHDWQDWRLEWLLEVGTLHLRMRGCQDSEVLARLRPLAEATPSSVAEWLALGQQIANTEHELRQQSRLPPYPWPERR